MDIDAKKTKERSPSFPFINLERALERVSEFYAEEKRGAAPYARAVMHWKYSPSSSGGLQTIAALKQYGLMDDVGGSGQARQLKLTDLALRIILDQREDSAEREGNVRRAAFNPPVASEVYNRWPELPRDSTLNHFLLVEKKFNDASALAAVKILKENHEFAAVEIGAAQSSKSELDSEPVIDLRFTGAAAPVPDVTLPVHGRRGSAGLGTAQPAATAGEGARLMLRHKGVAITIHFSEEPTREVFEYLAGYCNFEKENVPSIAEIKSKSLALSGDVESDLA